MKKKTIIIIAVIIMLAGAVAGFSFEKDIQEVDKANETASELKESALSLITSGEENEISSQSNSIVIKVEGEPFTEQYFNYRIALYKASGSETPEEDAFKLIKEEGFCYAFAKEHDLIPTEDEILAEVTNRRAIVESSDESHELAKVYFESMGLTEDEYWNELTRKYEVPGMITRYNVEKYLEDNKLPALDIDAITYEIINQEYFEEIESL